MRADLARLRERSRQRRAGEPAGPASQPATITPGPGAPAPAQSQAARHRLPDSGFAATNFMDMHGADALHSDWQDTTQDSTPDDEDRASGFAPTAFLDDTPKRRR